MAINMKAQTVPNASELMRNDWTLAMVAVLALVVGVVLRVVLTTQLNAVTLPTGANVRYPATWSVGELSPDEPETQFQASNPRSGSTFQSQIMLLASDAFSTTASSDAITAWTLNLSDNREHFRNLASEVTRAAGRDAVKVTYAYVADVGVGSLTQLPVVVKAVDTLVPVGERLYVLRYEAEATVFEDDLPSYEQALSALVLPGGAQ